MALDRNELRQGLTDLLCLYQRCGITHLPSTVDQSAAQIVKSLVVSDQSAQTASSGSNQSSNAIPQTPDTSPRATGARQIADSSRAGTTTRAPNKLHAPHVSSELAGQVRASWTLPILSISERASRFAEIHERTKACRLCSNIVTFRQQTVLGDGNLQPTICFLGEAPGADEDRVGLPFVGKAGQLLTRIIEAMSLQRSEVYILNALKCRPPQNRTPMPDEIEHCRPFVEAQLDILQPKYIVCLGAVAVRSILNSTASIGQLRGRFHRYRDAHVVVTYHPAYVLRNESAKKLVWEDMLLLMNELGLKPRRPN